MLVCFQFPHTALSAPTWSPPLERFWATSGAHSSWLATCPAAPSAQSAVFPAHSFLQSSDVGSSIKSALRVEWPAPWAGTAKALHLYQSRRAEREPHYSCGWEPPIAAPVKYLKLKTAEMYYLRVPQARCSKWVPVCCVSRLRFL